MADLSNHWGKRFIHKKSPKTHGVFLNPHTHKYDVKVIGKSRNKQVTTLKACTDINEANKLYEDYLKENQ